MRKVLNFVHQHLCDSAQDWCKVKCMLLNLLVSLSVITDTLNSNFTVSPDMGFPSALVVRYHMSMLHELAKNNVS